MVEPLAAAMRLGPYVLGERLGLGGMAEVYIGQRAGPHGFAKKFAIKRILPELARDARFVAMFVDEARICAALQHPNIVQVVDFGESEGELFMAMEYVDGVSVARLLRNVAGKREKFPLTISTLIVRDVLRGLTYAHEATNDEGRPLGLVHRDVSPGNVLISRAGEVKLGDFGIVRSELVDRRTHPGELKGKLGYMSPEQVIGAEVDPRSDLFAVGILLAEMLITCPLFGGKNELEVLTRIHDADLATFERHAADIPPELAEIVRKSLAREPRARFQSAREFEEALERFTDANHLALDHAELSMWLGALGVLPSRSGTHSVQRAEPKPEHRDAPPETRPNPESGSEHKTSREVRRPTPPALSLDDGRAAGRIDLLELVATGRVRRRTKLVGRDGLGRPAADVPGTAELLRKAAFQFGEPEGNLAVWSATVDARTLPSRLYRLALSSATGLLVARAGSLEKRVFFVDGEPRCVTGSHRNELLGYRLLSRGIVDEGALRAALETRARSAMHLGEILVALGVMPPTVLLRELVEQLEDRFAELLGWRNGTLYFFEGIRSGEEDLRAQASAPGLVTRGVRERYGAEEVAILLAPSARALLKRGEARGLDPARLGVTDAERRVLERAVPAGTLERLVAMGENERFASAPETLTAAFIGLSMGLISAPGAGWAQG